MKTEEEIKDFIKTLETLIPKLEERQLQYGLEGNQFAWETLKDKIKERKVELNAAYWFLSESLVKCIEHEFIATIRLCNICGKSKSEFIAEKVKTQQDELKKWKELR